MNTNISSQGRSTYDISASSLYFSLAACAMTAPLAWPIAFYIQDIECVYAIIYAVFVLKLIPILSERLSGEEKTVKSGDSYVLKIGRIHVNRIHWGRSTTYGCMTIYRQLWAPYRSAKADLTSPSSPISNNAPPGCSDCTCRWCNAIFSQPLVGAQVDNRYDLLTHQGLCKKGVSFWYLGERYNIVNFFQPLDALDQQLPRAADVLPNMPHDSPLRQQILSARKKLSGKPLWHDTIPGDRRAAGTSTGAKDPNVEENAGSSHVAPFPDLPRQSRPSRIVAEKRGGPYPPRKPTTKARRSSRQRSIKAEVWTCAGSSESWSSSDQSSLATPSIPELPLTSPKIVPADALVPERAHHSSFTYSYNLEWSLVGSKGTSALPPSAQTAWQHSESPPGTAAQSVPIENDEEVYFVNHMSGMYAGAPVTGESLPLSSRAMDGAVSDLESGCTSHSARWHQQATSAQPAIPSAVATHRQRPSMTLYNGRRLDEYWWSCSDFSG
ncbi:hypothetical protein BKA62DRAFT_710404 [Auriculariales sp. MPI-PUGE-AT-0066]|nr:hypothetical protein BKA62DRAFT_710404 [Auriculariales sp. MPI-PUGE-AT-0066]